MEKQVLELLLDMQKEFKEFKAELKDIKRDMNDRFDVVDIKLNVMENKITQISRNLDTTTDQVVRNMEEFNLKYYQPLSGVKR